MSNPNQQPEHPNDILDGGEVGNLTGPDEHSPVSSSTINAGTVKGLDDDALTVKHRISLHHSWTAIILAFVFIVILAASTYWHYHTVELLYSQGKPDVAKELSSIFDKWFPVMTGFTGSAVTYFLTRDRT